MNRFLSIILLVSINIFAMEHDNNKDDVAPVMTEQQVEPQIIYGVYEKKFWENDELPTADYEVVDFAKLTACRLTKDSVITVGKQAALILKGCEFLGTVYLESMASLHVFDKSIIHEILGAKNAVIISDETSQIVKQLGWGGFVDNGSVKIVFRSKPSDPKANNTYPTITLFDK